MLKDGAAEEAAHVPVAKTVAADAARRGRPLGVGHVRWEVEDALVEPFELQWRSVARGGGRIHVGGDSGVGRRR